MKNFTFCTTKTIVNEKGGLSRAAEFASGLNAKEC